VGLFLGFMVNSHKSLTRENVESVNFVCKLRNLMLSVYVFTYIVYARMYVCICVCIYVYMYVCMYVYMCMYMYIIVARMPRCWL
jgi:hypothetical protein